MAPDVVRPADGVPARSLPGGRIWSDAPPFGPEGAKPGRRAIELEQAGLPAFERSSVVFFEDMLTKLASG